MRSTITPGRCSGRRLSHRFGRRFGPWLLSTVTACSLAPIDGDPSSPDAGEQAPGDAAAANDGSPQVSPGVGPYFMTPMFFNRDVSTTPKALTSATIINALVTEG